MSLDKLEERKFMFYLNFNIKHFSGRNTLVFAISHIALRDLGYMDTSHEKAPQKVYSTVFALFYFVWYIKYVYATMIG